MKTRSYPLLFLGILLLNACKKDPVTKPVKFTSTTYDKVGTYNSFGTPDNLLKDTISNTLLSFINATLPDGQNLTTSHPELFNNPAIGDITIKEQSDVYITFVSGDSKNANSIAYYTYPTNQPPTTATDIKTITYVFPNAGHLTGLKAGDKVIVRGQEGLPEGAAVTVQK